MSLFSRLFGKKEAAAEVSASEEHAVIVHFDYGSTDLSDLFALEDQLESAIGEAEVGMFDGNEVAVDGSDAYLYMYGPDAGRLLEAVKPILESSPVIKNGTALLRYGPPVDGVKEEEIRLK